MHYTPGVSRASPVSRFPTPGLEFACALQRLFIFGGSRNSRSRAANAVQLGQGVAEPRLGRLVKRSSGRRPDQTHPRMVDTAEQIARKSPCTLAEIDRQLREIHPDAPAFSLDSLARHLKLIEQWSIVRHLVVRYF